MVYTVFYKTSSFAGYCFLLKNSIHPQRCDVFNFNSFKASLVKIQICSFIVEKRFEDVKDKDYIKVYIHALDKETDIEEDVDFMIHAASLASPQFYSVCPIDVLKPNVIGNCYLLQLAEKKENKGLSFI